ncbi:MAG TPA: 50S ribosomal protein L11 methyltransferase, partial [Burkholderiales bacterium]|nr:50S ribosomal protein L11 methyltransferase [Burkholderiales bacterium]
MSFKQLIINTNWQQADKLSDIFLELNALSVSIEDQFEGTDLEQEIFTEPELDNSNLWENSKVIILFNNEVEIEPIIIKAKHLLGNDFKYTTELINNQNWVKLTQDQFNPIKITDNFYIVPSWHLSPNLNATSIILDPGLAFGTGSPPTTFMCLEWLSFNLDKLPVSTILDYGCGSGILAISAKKLGAKKVTGVDIDEQAILASNSNAKINNVNIEFEFPKKLSNKIKYDIVIANI